jgi:hypothetical protein
VKISLNSEIAHLLRYNVAVSITTMHGIGSIKIFVGIKKALNLLKTVVSPINDTVSALPL